jgi:uncharacterized lipoprotein YmbA
MYSKTLVVAVLTLLAGCASVPAPHYYTLDMKPSGTARSGVNLAVQRIRVAEPLLRKDILVKKSPTEIEYYALAQWAANLDELVRDKLTAEFGPMQEGRKTLYLSARLLDFEQVDLPGGAEVHARLEVQFLGSPNGAPLLAKTYDATSPASAPTAAAAVQALSQCIENIAKNVAQDAATL